MNYTANGPTAQHLAISGWVWYEGTDALREGEGVCYNIAHGTATERDAKRCNHVVRPSATTAGAFAGVAARDYMASPTGRFIEIYCPGSRGVNVALGVDTVLNTGLLTFQVGGGSGAGRFVAGKYVGRGAAVPRQTVSAITSGLDGSWSLATDGVTLTIASTAGLAPGGTVVLLGGKNEGSNKAVVPGKHVIASITSDTVLVLANSAVGATPTAALTCTGYAYVGNPKCQADLLDGEEVCGAEFVAPPGATGGAITAAPFGVTYVCAGLTISADATVALAQGKHYGHKKAFFVLGTMTTKAFVVNPVTAGLQLDGSTAMVTAKAMDAAGDGLFLEFNGAKWCATGLVGGTTLAAT